MENLMVLLNGGRVGKLKMILQHLRELSACNTCIPRNRLQQWDDLWNSKHEFFLHILGTGYEALKNQQCT